MALSVTSALKNLGEKGMINYEPYSFVTLTTLGYGDISPVLPLARFLVYMEAIVGVFYMAILVASLIGVRLSDRSMSTGGDDS